MSEYDKELQTGTEEYEEATKPKRSLREAAEERERQRQETPHDEEPRKDDRR